MRFTTCLLVAGLALSGAACTGHDETAKPAPPTTTTTAPAPTTTTTGAPAATDLSDGEHLAYITAMDVDQRSLTIDVIQLKEDVNGHPEVVNENPRLRTLTVAGEVPVTVLAIVEDGNLGSVPGTFEGLPAHFEATAVPAKYPGRLHHSPFSFRLAGGTVTSIDEFYVP